MANADNLFHDLREKYGFPDGKFVKEWKFEILGRHSVFQSVSQASVPEDYDGHRPRDVILLRIHGAKTSALAELNNERSILEMLNRHPKASSHILIPLETFWIDGPSDRHLCWVLELLGPDIQFMADVCGPEDNLYPAAMVWKLTKQALESLSFLHSKDVCHGYLQRMSLVLTHPFLDASNRDEVMRFYGQPGIFNGIENLYETCTDKEEAPDRLDFRLKLTHLFNAFPISEGENRNQAPKFIRYNAPPPELLFGHFIQPPVDAWDLAILLTDIVAGEYEFNTRLCGSKGKALEKLCYTRRFLGQLPLKYLKRLPHGQQTITEFDQNTLYTAIIKNPFEGEKQVFADEEYELLVKLLKKMLAYDSRERYTADQALRDKFFMVERPANEA
ncbi:MAG: hypothetical protein MMC33_007057 [Icmadophila ericetorum]|nr:hypothetical protein [Icmadophila ericetorum]